MIKAFFIGKPVHWLLVGLLIPIGYLAGSSVFHVTHFVMWASGLFVLAFFLVTALWLTCTKEDSLTRDPIPDEEDIKLREYVD